MDLTPVALSGVLALGLVVQLALPSSTAPPPVRMSQRVTVRPVTPPEPVAAYPDILQHSLFNAARSMAQSAGDAAAPAGAFALLGVAYTGRTGSAIVRDAAGAVRALSLGETVDGWRLAAVSRDNAVVVRGNLSQSLKVGAPAANTPAAQPVAQ